ncbi:MAG: V-type ATP synthase subunit K [Clostridia bacterium]|nr:V-type ATP synthase subunit K [Clostridia bacterium]
MKRFRKFAAVAILAILVLAVCGAALAESQPVLTIGAEPPVDNTPKGYIWAAIGACIAMILPGIGSAWGVGMAGRAAAGVAAEDPEKSGACLMFELLPATQGLYGFVIAMFIAVFSGILSGTVMQLPTDLGQSFFYASLPIGVVGLVSAYFQSRVCCAGIGIVAKQGNGGMGITFAIMVELYAILALIISILMVVGVPVNA